MNQKYSFDFLKERKEAYNHSINRTSKLLNRIKLERDKDSENDKPKRKKELEKV